MSTTTRKPMIQWDEIPRNLAEEPFMVLVEGEQGSGKTHLAMTFPEPIFLLDTENRADKVAAKFAGYKEVYRKRCQTFNDIRQTLLQLVFPHFERGTVVIDSGSDLQRYAESEFLVEAKRDKIYPTVLWAQVFAKIDGLLSTLRDHGFYTVITARLRDEFAGKGDDAERTGNRILDGYRRLPYLADIHMRLPGDGTAIIYKNGFRNTPIERTEPLKAPNFETIVDELIVKAQVPVTGEGLQRMMAAEKTAREAQEQPPAAAAPTVEKTPSEAATETAASTSDVPAAEGELLATYEAVNEVYKYGRGLGISKGNLQMLVHQVRGVDHTQDMTVEELEEWHRLIDEFAEEHNEAQTA